MEKLIRWDVIAKTVTGSSPFASPITAHYGECVETCAGKPLSFSEMTDDQKRKFKLALYAIEEFNRSMGHEL
jgi:hypothetical protein